MQSGVELEGHRPVGRMRRCTTPTAQRPCAIATSRSTTTLPTCQRHRGTPRSSVNETRSSWPHGSTAPDPHSWVRAGNERRRRRAPDRALRDRASALTARPRPRRGARGSDAFGAPPPFPSRTRRAVGDEPLAHARTRRGSRTPAARARSLRHGPVSASSSSPSVGIGAPRCLRIRSATMPVQPVWWLAPRPAPLSPWKYSLKKMLSFQAGSVWSLSTQPWHGRRPSSPTRKSEISRAPQVLADLLERPLLARAGRVLERQVVAEVARVAEHRVDDEVIDGEPDRTAPVRVAAEHRGRGLGRLVVDRRLVPTHVEVERVLEVPARDRAEPVRREKRVLVEQPLKIRRTWSTPTTPTSVRPLGSRSRPAGAGARRAGRRAARSACRASVRESTTSSSTTANAITGSTPTIDRTLIGTTDPSGRRSWS